MRYEDYEPFCKSQRQREMLWAYCEFGAAAGAQSLGLTGDRNLRKVIKGIRERAGEGRPLEETTHSREIGPCKRYVVTCAQNATSPHLPFLGALRRYCEHNGAELIVVPLRYRNPTSDREHPDDWWHSALGPYLCGERLELFPGLMLMGDIKIQPTAVNPLSGLHTITGNKCGIFAHTKVAMESVPTQGTQLPKLLYTTGAVTRQNYSDSKAGKKGEFHHVLGAIIAEQGEDGEFHIRNINANKRGHFTDLDKRYSPEEVTDAPPPAAFVMGDLHAARADEGNLKACHEILDTLKPRRVVLHDVLDFQSASHHNNWFERFLLRHQGRSNVADELRQTCAMLDDLASKADAYVVSSNHDEHLFKWLANHHNGLDLENALLYHRLKADMLQSIVDKDEIPDPLELASRDLLKSPVRFVKRDSLQVHGIEMGYHGDKGPNGAKGSVGAFDRIGVKTITGHGHAPGIVGGSYRAGTSSLLDMGYNQGPSSWLHSHVLVHADGKRTHIHVIDGKWRA